MDIVGVYLISGDEVIGKSMPLEGEIAVQDAQDPGWVILSAPLKMVPMQNANGGIMSGFMPLIMSNPKGTFVLAPCMILIRPFEPVPEIINMYIKQTTSIQIASNINLKKN